MRAPPLSTFTVHTSPRILSSLPRPFPTTLKRSYSKATSPNLLKATNIPAPHLGHIRVLSFNSPRNRNAISRQLLDELSNEIATVKTQVESEVAKGDVVGEGTRVLILASELDNVFCAGADLKERATMTRDETTTFLHDLRSTLAALQTLPIPTIAAVSSIALGGGLEVALAATLRVFAMSASIGLPETRLAIIPGAGGTYRLRRLIGEARTQDLILTGRRIGGFEAYGLGICERLVEDMSGDLRAETLESAVDTAKAICEGGPRAVGAALRAVRGGSAEVEGMEYETVVGSGDRDEALKAFRQKRKPMFAGK